MELGGCAGNQVAGRRADIRLGPLACPRPSKVLRTASQLTACFLPRSVSLRGSVLLGGHSAAQAEGA